MCLIDFTRSCSNAWLRIDRVVATDLQNSFDLVSDRWFKAERGRTDSWSLSCGIKPLGTKGVLVENVDTGTVYLLILAD